MRRSAISIGTSIAEGAGKMTRPEFARFLQNAFGNASELEYELLLAHDLGYLAAEQHGRLTEQIIEVKKMLTGFIQFLYGSRTGTDG
jgi:four helix bundle protein